jgi:hypothetical protein
MHKVWGCFGIPYRALLAYLRLWLAEGVRARAAAEVDLAVLAPLLKSREMLVRDRLVSPGAHMGHAGSQDRMHVIYRVSMQGRLHGAYLCIHYMIWCLPLYSFDERLYIYMYTCIYTYVLYRCNTCIYMYSR